MMIRTATTRRRARRRARRRVFHSNARGGGDDSYAEPLLPGTTRDGEEEEEEDVEHGGTNVQYESALKPSKIKSRNLSPIRTPELAMARASNLRASAGAFTPSTAVGTRAHALSSSRLVSLQRRSLGAH